MLRAREPRQRGARRRAPRRRRRRARPGAAAAPRARQPAAHGGAVRRHRQLLRRRADRAHAAHAPRRGRLDARGERDPHTADGDGTTRTRPFAILSRFPTTCRYTAALPVPVASYALPPTPQEP